MSPPANTSWVLVSLVIALSAYVATVRRRIVDRIREIKKELEESDKGVIERIVLDPPPTGQSGTSTRTTLTSLPDDKKRALQGDLKAFPRSILALTTAEALLVIGGLILAGVYGWRQLGLGAAVCLESWGVGFFLQALVLLSVLHFVEWVREKNLAWLLIPAVSAIAVAALLAILVAVVASCHQGP
jgi:hypothetical protein